LARPLSWRGPYHTKIRRQATDVACTKVPRGHESRDRERRQRTIVKGPNLMSRRSVQLLADGETLDEVYLVTDKQLRANKNGNLYLQVELRDRTGTISARMWNATEHHFRGFESGDFLQVKGKVQLFQGALQMILSHIDRIESEKVELAD